MTLIFNGRKFAREKEVLLSNQVTKLLKGGIRPKLVSIIVGEDPASILYVNLKKKAAERIGAEVKILRYKDTKILSETIKQLNKDKKVYGIMIQLPLPKKFKNETQKLINLIDFKKDVDGLRENSPFLPATVRAIFEIIQVSSIQYQVSKPKVAVIGADGMVGKPLVRELRIRNYELCEETQDADILISSTGVPGLIKSENVKKGALVIDVGSPKGDIEPSAGLKASFLTPVPGGVGPVTISCLLENLVEAAYNNATHTQGKDS